MISDNINAGLTKHEQIIRYIKALEVHKKVSVRQIAKELDVSEGTAYRAIKEAENRGLVSSIPKVGTIRIQEQETREIGDLTLKELIMFVDGEALSGEQNLLIAPTRYVVGCNSRGIVQQYLEKGALLIVGDVLELQRVALERDSHLMVTGAFAVTGDIIQMAEEKNLVVISCPYDTFEAISLLNRAVYDRRTEKELVRVEDIMVKEVHYLTADAAVEDWHKMSQATGHSRFPVVDQNKLVIGIATAVDVAGIDRASSILSAMTTDVLRVEGKTLLTHLSRMLMWEGFELVPIVDEGRLIGVVSRQDILKAFQQTQKQPQFGETVDNLVMSGFKLEDWEEGTKIAGGITQFMINESGTASPGILATVISTAAYITARKQLKLNTMVDSLTVHAMEPVAVGDWVEVYSKIIHLEKRSCVFDVGIYSNGNIRIKALVGSRIIKK